MYEHANMHFAVGDHTKMERCGFVLLGFGHLGQGRKSLMKAFAG
jgi:hypothetical protein